MTFEWGSSACRLVYGTERAPRLSLGSGPAPESGSLSTLYPLHFQCCEMFLRVPLTWSLSLASRPLGRVQVSLTASSVSIRGSHDFLWLHMRGPLPCANSSVPTVGLSSAVVRVPTDPARAVSCFFQTSASKTARSPAAASVTCVNVRPRWWVYKS